MTHLKLHRAEPKPKVMSDPTGPFKFPRPTRATRRLMTPVPRLVRDDPRAAFGGTGVLPPPAPIPLEQIPADPTEGDVIRSAELVRQIEHTLDRMQGRLDRFKHDLRTVERQSLKFPTLPDDDGPRSAA
jgi:hypothetical protein